MGTVALEGNLKKERFLYPGKPPHLQGDLYRKCASEGHSNWFVADRIARDLSKHLYQHPAHCSLRHMLPG